MSFYFKKYLRLAVIATIFTPIGVANAESIIGAMSRAYDNNPDLAVARAGLRATDEGVAIAKAGYRPVISGSLTGTYTDRNSVVSRNATGAISITQQLFDGFATKNNVKVAEAGVFAGRESLRSTEISILQSAAQAYANLARDNQIVHIRRQNINFLDEQLNAATSRLNVGEGTRTDVSQARAQLASAKAQLTGAIAQAKSSSAVYVQIIGSAPKKISQPKTIARLLPRSLDEAVSKGFNSHPSVFEAQYNVDAAEFQIKANKASLLPGVSVTGSLTGADDSTVTIGRSTTKLVRGTVSVPLYSGGANYARIRQAKQTLAQRKAQVESARRAVERSIVESWVSYESAVATLAANQVQLGASRLALNGIIEERKVGQRTTLDVLNAQQSVLQAQESIVQNKRNAVVSSYSTLASMGLLTVDYLKLKVTRYNPDKHYQAVKDKWFGLRISDN